MKEILCSNFNSPRGDNGQLIFDFKNREKILQHLEEKHSNSARENFRKTETKKPANHMKYRIMIKILGYREWQQYLLKIVCYLKITLFLENYPSIISFTKKFSGVNHSITWWSISYWLTFLLHCAKNLKKKTQMYWVSFYLQLTFCYCTAKIEKREVQVSSLSIDSQDYNHPIPKNSSDTCFSHQIINYVKFPWIFIITLTFAIARKIHSIYKNQKEHIWRRSSSYFNLMAIQCFSKRWNKYRISKLLTNQSCKTNPLFIFLLLAMFANTEGAKPGGGFGCKSQNVNTLKGASQACLPKEYSKYELPNPSGVNPIRVELLIQEVLRINDKDYSITFSCYYNIYWPDKRIRLSPDFGREMLSKEQINNPNFNLTLSPDVSVPMNLEMIKDLWLPNILIYNLKTFKVMDVLSKLAGLWISADYTVLYSTATHITFICPMHFDKFPLDTQSCKFQVGSYSYDDSQMTFTTLRAGYDGKLENSIALDYAIEIRNLAPKDSILLFDGLGNFSLAGFELVLNRYVSTYIITYYLPSGLFVIVSWISFLIPMDVIPGRMALLVTLFLVLVNIFNNVTTNTPKAEGLTAIEAWMLACILFVFGALIE